MFTVVVPTMWKYDPFVSFIEDVIEQPLVSEVIIIDNDPENKPEYLFSHEKLKVVTYGENIFVNPSWNLGVELASNENICIMNDDVIFDVRVFSKIKDYMTKDNFGIAGAHPGEQQLFQIPFVNGEISIVEWQIPSPDMSHGYLFGFGTLFFVKKSKWFPIPSNLLIYYGDDWLHMTQGTYDRDIFLITNMFYNSPSAQTCTKILTLEERNQILEAEGKIYQQATLTFKDLAYQEYIESEYQLACNTPTDINQHVPLLRQLASECNSVVELGVREGWSTRAFLTQRNKFRSYDIIVWPYVSHLFETMKNIGRDFEYIQASSLEIELDECDMIFFDTEHTYNQLSSELKLHGNKATKYLVFHDTVSYKDALIPAIEEFLEENNHWQVKEHYTHNNGILILERINNE